MKEKEIFTNWLEEIDNNFGFYTIKKISKKSFEILNKNELTAEKRVLFYILSSVCEDFAEYWEQNQPIEPKIFEPLKDLIKKGISLIGNDSVASEEVVNFTDQLIKNSLALLK